MVLRKDIRAKDYGLHSTVPPGSLSSASYHYLTARKVPICLRPQQALHGLEASVGLPFEPKHLGEAINQYNARKESGLSIKHIALVQERIGPYFRGFMGLVKMSRYKYEPAKS